MEKTPKAMPNLIILDRKEVEKRIAQYKSPENNIEYRQGALYALEWVLFLSKPAETVWDAARIKIDSGFDVTDHDGNSFDRGKYKLETYRDFINSSNQ